MAERLGGSAGTAGNAAASAMQGINHDLEQILVNMQRRVDRARGIADAIVGVGSPLKDASGGVPQAVALSMADYMRRISDAGHDLDVQLARLDAP